MDINQRPPQPVTLRNGRRKFPVAGIYEHVQMHIFFLEYVQIFGNYSP